MVLISMTPVPIERVEHSLRVQALATSPRTTNWAFSSTGPMSRHDFGIAKDGVERAARQDRAQRPRHQKPTGHPDQVTQIFEVAAERQFATRCNHLPKRFRDLFDRNRVLNGSVANHQAVDRVRLDWRTIDEALNDVDDRDSP
jgi:hypothetical protein